MASAQEKLNVIKKLNGSEESLGVLDIKRMLQGKADNLTEKEQEIVKEIKNSIDSSKTSILDLKEQMLNDPTFSASIDNYIKKLTTHGKFLKPRIDIHSSLDRLMFSLYIKKEIGADISFKGLQFDSEGKALVVGTKKKIEIKKVGKFGTIEVTTKQSEDESKDNTELEPITLINPQQAITQKSNSELNNNKAEGGGASIISKTIKKAGSTIANQTSQIVDKARESVGNINSNEPLDSGNEPGEEGNKNEDLDESDEMSIQDLERLFGSFKDTIERLDTPLDIQTSSEKISNKDLLDTNYNALIIRIRAMESQNNIDTNTKNKMNTIKLYLAKYFADELNVENSNFTNYQLSNKLAFDVLGSIEGVSPPPKAPEMGDIISSFKGTGIGTYITSKINAGEEISNIFESKAVKDATEENGEKLIDKYEDQLEEYLESIDGNNRKGLSQIQKGALDLLMDVNGAGWSVKNSTTDKWDVAGWDLAAIGSGIGAGFGVGAGLGAWTGAGALVTGSAGAIAGGVTATLGMMVNHGDNYFGEDWKKGGTELLINTAMFGAGGALFKGARMIQGGSKLLSGRGAIALGTEATGDVAIGVSTDITRSWAYEMNIELGDAIVNNLVWALFPITLRGKQGFSEIRQKLAKNVSEGQRKASILAKLGDKVGAKKIIDDLNKKIDTFKINNTHYIDKKTGTVFVKNENGKLINKKTGVISRRKEANLQKIDTTLLKNYKRIGKTLEYGKNSTKIISEQVLVGGKHIKKIGNKAKEAVSNQAKNLKEKINKKDYTKKAPEDIFKLKNTYRLIAAEQFLGKKINTAQQQSILNAHNKKTIPEKARELRKGNFNKNDTRILLESGVSGKGNRFDFIKKYPENSFIKKLNIHFQTGETLNMKIGGKDIKINKKGLKYTIEGEQGKFTGPELYKNINGRIDTFSKTVKGKDMTKKVNKHLEFLQNNKTLLKDVYSKKFWDNTEGSLQKIFKKTDIGSKFLFRLKNLTIGDYLKEVIQSSRGENWKSLITARTLLTGRHSEKVWRESGGRPQVFSPSTWVPTANLPRKSIMVIGGVATGVEAYYNWDDRSLYEHGTEGFKNLLTLHTVGILGELIADKEELMKAAKSFGYLAKTKLELIADS